MKQGELSWLVNSSCCAESLLWLRKWPINGSSQRGEISLALTISLARTIQSVPVADSADWDKAINDLGPLAKSAEDLLLGVLFPMQAKEFLTLRENGGLR
jgi:hypothetical protein